MASFIKYKKVRIWVGFISVLMMVCVISFAADPNDPNTANTSDQEQNVEAKAIAADEKQNTAKEAAPTKEVLTAIERRMQKRISVDFRNTPIEDVLRIMAEQVGIDIIKSPTVTGNVTATINNVPLQEALDNILVTYQCGYVASENMIRIAPISELAEKSEKLVNKVYKITYADVTEVEKSLKSFISLRGVLSANPGTSNIIVSDTESKIKAIDTFIAEIDRMTQQVLVEVRIYDVTDTDGFDLGVNWNAGRNTETATGDFMTETTGKGIVYNPEQPTATGDAVVFPPLQTSTKRANPFAAGSFDKVNGGSVRLGFLNDAFSVDFVLTALQKQEWATLLANPSIMVLDNEKAKFEIIRQIPYTENQQSSTGGATMTSTVFKDVGVILEVTPHITRDNMLRLHIQPEFSVAEARVETDGGTLAPAVNKRKLDTIALLKNGQTVVLGGLRKQEVTKNLYKTPMLGDMPLLGGLFRSEDESTKTTELLVFITPKIIDVPVLQSHEIETYNYTDIPKVKYPPLEHRE